MNMINGREPIDRAVLSGTALFQELDRWPRVALTVTGYAGSGYSTVTERYGEEVYRGRLPVEWVTDVLVVLRQQFVPNAAVAMLEGLGISEPRVAIARLDVGQAIVIRRLSSDQHRTN